MRIKKITLKNYKIFKDEQPFEFKGNLIFFVGENNTGKSTVLEAINFVKSGLPKDKKIADIKNKYAADNDPIVCTIKFEGEIKNVIQDFSESKYDKYVFEEDGKETLVIQRSSEEKIITQGGKEVKLDIKKVTIWNPETNQFENPSGIDSVISTLFETQFVWADTDPADISDFGATKICGRLLTEAIGDFFNGDQWKKFAEIHRETFHGTGDSLSKRTQTVEDKIKTILESQYGAVDIKFNFSLPDASTFYKSADITVNDGIETKLEEKGSGMQRAIALAMIQVYAQSLLTHPTDIQKTKPFFFFIDEPEICLHPKAQRQLMDALVSITQTRQIFVTTHSPYVLKTFEASKHDLVILKRDGSQVQVIPSSGLTLFKWSPSWGEINYHAYNLYTFEFHNELYGHIQEENSAYTEELVEKFFVSKMHKQDKDWVRVKKDGTTEIPKKLTLMSFIRNTIHHPENRKNLDFTDKELQASIEAMIALLK